MAEKNQPQLPAVNALISVYEKSPNPKLNSGKRKTREKLGKFEYWKKFWKQKNSSYRAASALPEPIKPDEQPKPEVMEQKLWKRCCASGRD
jgi:hypothetical protein